MADKTRIITEPVIKDLRINITHDGTNFLVNVVCSQEPGGAELRPANYSAAERTAAATFLTATLREAKVVWTGY